jgi:hypothetical protein
MDGDESPLKRRAQPSRAAGASTEGNVEPTSAIKRRDTTLWSRGVRIWPPTYHLGALDRDKYQQVGEAHNLSAHKVE